MPVPIPQAIAQPPQQPVYVSQQAPSVPQASASYYPEPIYQPQPFPPQQTYAAPAPPPMQFAAPGSIAPQGGSGRMICCCFPAPQ